MKKVLALLVAMILCVSLFASCGEKDSITTPEDKELDSSIVVKEDGVELSLGYYNIVYNNNYQMMSQYSQYYGEDWINMEIEAGKTVKDYIAESSEIQMEQYISIIKLAEKNGITADKKIKEAVEEQRKELLTNYGGEEGYKDFLLENHTTDKAVRSYLETYLILESLFEKLTKEGEEAYIEDSEIEKMFAEEFKDKLRVQHVLISTMADEQTGAPAKTEEEALKIANEVIAKLDKGEKFDDLISNYGEDPGMSAGQFYVFGTGEMVEEFEKASRELKIGQYTKKPVKSDYGYHIIKRYEINKDIPEYNDFKVSKLQEKLSEVLVEKADSLKIKWDKKIIDKYLEKVEKEAEKKAEKETEKTDKEAEKTENK